LLQTLRRRLRESGIFRLIPRMLALSAVQRQAAASRSASPWMRVQHGSTGGLPRVTFSRPLSTLAQTPSLRASLGHLAIAGLGLGCGVGLGLGLGFGLGEGLGLCFGLGEGQPQLPQADIVVKKRKLRIKKRAKDFVVLEAIVNLTFGYRGEVSKTNSTVFFGMCELGCWRKMEGSKLLL